MGIAVVITLAKYIFMAVDQSTETICLEVEGIFALMISVSILHTIAVTLFVQLLMPFVFNLLWIHFGLSSIIFGSFYL